MSPSAPPSKSPSKPLTLAVLLLAGLAVSACTTSNNEAAPIDAHLLPAGGVQGDAASGGQGAPGGETTGGTGSPGGGAGGGPTGGGAAGGGGSGGSGGATGGGVTPADAGVDAMVGPPGDLDDDGIPDDADNCPRAANHGQEDGDADAAGDPCDVCPEIPDPDQADADADGRGDVCDLDDGDGDGVPDNTDDCPDDPDPRQTDDDRDGIGDACDNCPAEPNFSQLDGDADGIGDACEAPGDDADGVRDEQDLCPHTPDPAQTDSDADGRGDACDNCRQVPNFSQVDADADGIGDACEGAVVPDAGLPPEPDAAPPEPDAAPDLCRGVACGPDGRCEPASGACVPRSLPGDACAGPDDCLESDTCVVDGGAVGDPFGGVCQRPCQRDGDCGADRACVDTAVGLRCRVLCEGECREGWTCADLPDGRRSACVPDCRVSGCSPDLACDRSNGLCGERCPWDCGAGEVCRDRHCVRNNGTCATDYHCETRTETCREGRCIPAEYTDCTQDVGACDPSQACTDGGANDFCLFSCVANADCGQNHVCLAGSNVCYYEFCGATFGNGVLFGACTGGSDPGWPGNCLPLDATNRALGYEGICVEGGTALIGAVCNSQANARTPQDAALRCVGEGVCIGDADNVLDPENDGAARGTCREVCDPAAPACQDGTVCIDFTEPNDPATPMHDESRPYGVCLVSDCDLDPLQPDPCGAGRACRPHSFSDRAGYCGPAGVTPEWAACLHTDDCQANLYCADSGGGPVCIPLCDDIEDRCTDGAICVDQGGLGVCI